MNIDPRDKFITLKEAAKISGYSPDYLGQLIRKGKLPGKQIYLNVAWVTTEAAVREHMNKNAIPGNEAGKWSRMMESFKKWRIAHSSTDYMLRMARRVIYLVIILLFIFVAFLIYAFFGNLTRPASERPVPPPVSTSNSYEF